MRTSASTRPKPPQGKHKLSYLFRSLRSHASSAWRRKGRGLWKVAEVNGIRTRLKRSKVVLVRDESGENSVGRSGEGRIGGRDCGRRKEGGGRKFRIASACKKTIVADLGSDTTYLGVELLIIRSDPI